ncbi:MAG: phosphoglycerate kinase [Desulfurococcales archaeon]|nr:phosphoglycerate kinase [Desulfurococcales archaeon]
MPFAYKGLTIGLYSDLDVRGRLVLLRLDLNSPLDSAGMILDDTRFRMHSGIVKALVDEGARLVVIAHQGRPGDSDFTRLERHAEVLSKVSGVPVGFVDDVIGPEARRRIRALGPGEVLLLDNVRLLSEEYMRADMETHASTIFATTLASLVDYYVNDAFSVSHRSQASIVGIPLLVPSVAGPLMHLEVEKLGIALEASLRPKVLVIGGAKLDDAVTMIRQMIEAGNVDVVLTTGLVSLLFHAAKGTRLPSHVRTLLEKRGASRIIDEARQLLAGPVPVKLPVDYRVEADGSVRVEPADAITGWPKDVGPATVDEYREVIREARVVVYRGPAGVIEEKQFREGTISLVRAGLESGAFTILGGGHFNSILREIPEEIKERVGHISSGGGAMVAFLTGRPLPGLVALGESYKRFMAG